MNAPNPISQGNFCTKMFLARVLGICLALLSGAALYARGNAAKTPGEVKIGFIVKDAQEPWFQDEWKYAEIAAEENNFTLVKIGASDGEKLLAALDNLGAQGAQGVIACVPDVKLGPAVVAKSQANGLKLMSVDDRLLGSDGNPIEEVHHMGISAFEIGKLVGNSIADEIEQRSWSMDEVYALRISFDELPTARSRTEGATEALLERGFPANHIIDAPQKYGTEGAFNAANIVIAKSPQVQKWVLFGLNDEAVIGGVRALEGNNISADSVVGVGIGGTESGLNEFLKQEATGFFGTVMISPKRHGYETALNMYNWIANKQEPPKLIYTSGQLATRQNYQAVQKDMGLN